MTDLIPYRRVHLIGVGGSGMSALAKLLAGAGHLVTGSDLFAGPGLAGLADLGLDVWSGHRPERIGDSDLVVASSAIPDHDPEWLAAIDRGQVCWRRPELLSSITAGLATVGFTGTHGKSSSTAMAVTAFREMGLAPSFVVGADLVEYRTNASYGSDPLLLLEADEAFGTFEALTLAGLMVTNVEADHLDHFGSLANLEEAFVRVAGAVSGPVLACADDPGALALARQVDAYTYGLSPQADFVISELEHLPLAVRFRLSGPKTDVKVGLRRPGTHMAANAAGVVSLAVMLGHQAEAAAAGVGAFLGIRRRFEHRGTVGGITIIDDYAHHPSEVAATLEAARRSSPRRLVAVFQPHLFSRTQRLSSEFGAALSGADWIVVSDVYGSREIPVPGVTGRLVADATQAAGADRVDYVRHRVDLADHLLTDLEAGDMVVVMGAGDITTVATELVARIGERV